MKRFFLIVLAVFALKLITANAFAYSDANGYHPSGDCDIFAADGCGDTPVTITAYGTRVDARDYVSPSARAGNARAYCKSIPGIAASQVLTETCMKMEIEAGARINR